MRAMPDLETLTFDTDTMMRIFQLSRVSIYRRNQKAREGRGKWPLPIPSEPNQALRWNAATVMNYLQSADAHQTPSTPLIESPTKRSARHSAAMKELEKLGVKFPSKGGKNDQ